MLPLRSSPMLALDTETTGVNAFRDRVVTCSMIFDNGAGKQTERDWIINPGIEIPTGASDVHGVTTAIAQAKGILPEDGLRQIAASLYPMMKAGIPLVIYNAPYDITILKAEFDRYGIKFPLEFDRIIDPLVLDKQLDKWRKGKRQLTVTAAHYGYDLTNAHTADADNRAAIHVARAVLEKYFTDDTTIEELQELQKEWKAEQAADLQKYFRKSKNDPSIVINGEWPFMVTEEAA